MAKWGRWGLVAGLVAGGLSVAACVPGPGTVTGSDAQAGADVSRAPSRSQVGAYLGELRLMPTNYVVEGFALADGRSLGRESAPDLHRALGERFGGDGEQSFAVPNLPPLVSGNAEVRYQIATVGAEPRYEGRGEGLGDAFASEVRLWPGDKVPAGWLPCDGREMPVRGNEMLFDLLQTTYGGDGKSTFNLPKLSAPEGLQYILCNYGHYPYKPSGRQGVLVDDDDRRQGVSAIASEIRLFAGRIVPAGWRPCDGQTYAIRQEGLSIFALLGTRFGGDGHSTFAVPNLTFADQPALTYAMSVVGFFPPRS